jgi:enamine deaminase RidA (YjgF/YER057c/UK114 family)
MGAWLYPPRSWAAFFALLFVALTAPTAHSGETRLAISGYDPVAYFTDGRPVPGLTEFEHVWHDARWRFSSASHRDLFVGDPYRYAPQYDGYCAGGMAADAPHKDTVDPEAWAIVDGKLYLTHTTRSLDRWSQNAADRIKRADANWPTIKTLAAPTIIGQSCRNHSPAVPPVVVSVDGGGRQVILSGQVALDDDGSIVGKGDMRAQIEQVGKNIQTCLTAAGANASDIFLTRTYVTDTDAFSRNADMYTRYLGPQSRTSTVLEVPKLTVGPDFLVEIEAMAAIN